jgi:hypothetical protein
MNTYEMRCHIITIGGQHIQVGCELAFGLLNLESEHVWINCFGKVLEIILLACLMDHNLMRVIYSKVNMAIISYWDGWSGGWLNSSYMYSIIYYLSLIAQYITCLLLKRIGSDMQQSNRVVTVTMSWHKFVWKSNGSNTQISGVWIFTVYHFKFYLFY